MQRCEGILESYKPVRLCSNILTIHAELTTIALPSLDLCLDPSRGWGDVVLDAARDAHRLARVRPSKVPLSRRKDRVHLRRRREQSQTAVRHWLCDNWRWVLPLSRV